MNTLTDPLKRIARDLVDKKLWPVAVLLLAAIVAVPFLIGGSSAEEVPPPAPVAAPAPGAPGSKSLITMIDEGDGGKDTRPGRIKDPFYDPPAPPAPESASGASPAASAATAAAPPTGGGAPSGGASPAPSSSPQTTPQPTTPRPAATSGYYRTVARWSASERSKARPITRLTPFGGAETPAALYLGVTKSDASYAVFLLGPNATSTGDAECEQTDCRVIGLKTGQSQVVTVQPSDGSAARTYRLEVASVKAVTTDAATARALRAKVHADGREAMRAMWQHRPTAEALQPIQYDEDRGLLFTTATAKDASK